MVEEGGKRTIVKITEVLVDPLTKKNPGKHEDFVAH